MPRIALAAALGVGASGALVDVSSYVDLEEGLKRSFGRTRQYDDVEVGTFSFVLDNGDGRFTPENASSPLATKLTEGALACVQVGSRLTPGRVQSIEPTFPEGQPSWAQIRVTCEDMLGDASRSQLSTGWREALVQAASPVGYYPMDDSADSGVAEDQSGAGRGAYEFVIESGTVTFEQPGVEHDRIRFTGAGDFRIKGVGLTYVPIGSFFSFWIEPALTTGTFSIQVGALTFAMTGGFFQLSSSGGSVTSLSPVVAGREYFVEADATALTLKIDGVLQGTLPSAGAAPTTGDPVVAFWGDVTPTDVYLSDFALTNATVRGDLLKTALAGGGAAAWLQLLDAASTRLTFATLPAALSKAQLYIEPGGSTALDVLNLILKSEQGHAYSTGTGTLTAVTERVTVRERARPEAVTASFDAALDLGRPPQFERPIRDLVSRVDAQTAVGRLVVTDAAVAARAGSSSTSEEVAFAVSIDTRAWAQDRIIRGSNTRLQVQSVVVDAMTTATDRSAALLGLVPGDRIRLTNLPSTQLGYSTWDAWVIGCQETHSLTEHSFELFVAPVLDAPYVFDTARFAGGTTLTLSGAITAVATSISVATSSARLSTTETPYTILVDSEQMTVTAASAATPQVLTVVRGVNGSTAATHSAGAVVEMVPASVFAF